MTKITEASTYDQEHIFLCDCKDHYIYLVWDKDPEFKFLIIESQLHYVRLRDRIKNAWKVLWGRPLNSSEIMLTKGTVISMKNVFEDFLKE